MSSKLMTQMWHCQLMTQMSRRIRISWPCVRHSRMQYRYTVTVLVHAPEQRRTFCCKLHWTLKLSQLPAITAHSCGRRSWELLLLLLVLLLVLLWQPGKGQPHEAGQIGHSRVCPLHHLSPALRKLSPTTASATATTAGFGSHRRFSAAISAWIADGRPGQQ